MTFNQGVRDSSSRRSTKKGAVSNVNFRAFETALFLCFEEKQHVKKKKPRNEAKKGMTKRGLENPHF